MLIILDSISLKMKIGGELWFLLSFYICFVYFHRKYVKNEGMICHFTQDNVNFYCKLNSRIYIPSRICKRDM